MSVCKQISIYNAIEFDSRSGCGAQGVPKDQPVPEPHLLLPPSSFPSPLLSRGRTSSSLPGIPHTPDHVPATEDAPVSRDPEISQPSSSFLEKLATEDGAMSMPTSAPILQTPVDDLSRRNAKNIVSEPASKSKRRLRRSKSTSQLAEHREVTAGPPAGEHMTFISLLALVALCLYRPIDREVLPKWHCLHGHCDKHPCNLTARKLRLLRK